MAVKKKAAAPKARAKAAPKAAAKPAAKAAGKVSAAPAAKGGKKGLLIALGAVAVFAVIAMQTVMVARRQAAMKLDFVRIGSVVPMGLDDGQVQGARAIVGDKDGNIFFLDHKAVNTNNRLQKLDAMARFVTKYKPTAPSDVLVDPSGMDLDSKGRLWVAELNGKIHVFSPDLKHLKVFQAPEGDTVALAVTPDDQVLVCSRAANKVMVFDSEGRYQKEFGAPGTDTGDIANPQRMVCSVNGTIVVLEGVPTGLRAKVFGPDFAKKRQFGVENVTFCDPMLMCIDPADRIYFNDHLGGRGIVIFDAKSGKLFGEGKSTEDNMAILAPGALGVNKFTGRIYLNFQPGLVQASLPAPK